MFALLIAAATATATASPPAVQASAPLPGQTLRVHVQVMANCLADGQAVRCRGGTSAGPVLRRVEAIEGVPGGRRLVIAY